MNKFLQLMRFAVVGIAALSTSVFILYLLTDILRLWYIVSAILAFPVAFLVSFFLQKFWTFNDQSSQKLGQQMTIYLFIILLDLVINIALLYLLVDILIQNHLVAQVISGGLISVMNFVLYRRFVFRNS